MKSIKWVILLFAMLVTGQALHAQIGPSPCGASSSVTTWIPTVPYAVGQTVLYNGIAYQSLIANNTQWNPCSSPSQWSSVIGSGSGAVASVFGRTGTVAAASGDYTAAQVTGAASTSSTSTQSFSGPISTPQVGTIYHVDGFPSSCTVNGTPYTTQLDCAFYTAVYNSGSEIVLGSNTYSSPYTTCAGLVEPTTAAQVSIVGQVEGDNVQPTEIKATCSMQAVISHPDILTAQNEPYNMNIHNVNIDANNEAQQCVALYAEKIGHSEHVHCRNAISSTLAWMQFGDPTPAGGYQGIGYQYHLDDIFVAGLTGTPGTATATQSGGVPSFTVTAGGTYQSSNPQPILYGFGTSGTSNNPCTTMGTLTATMSGSSAPYTLTAITPTGFSGCGGTLYVTVPDLPLAPYGIETALTDSTFKDLAVSSVGRTAGIHYNNGGNVTIHEHPYGNTTAGMPELVKDSAANQHIGAELDSPTIIGAETDNSKALWTSTQFILLNGPPNGLLGFYMPNAGGSAILGQTCTNTVSANIFALVGTTTGPISHSGSAVYPNLLIGGQQCDTLNAVSYMGTAVSATNVEATNIITELTDNGSTGGVNIGSGSSTNNFISMSGARADFGYNASSGTGVVQSRNGIDFDLNATYANGKVAGISADGAFQGAVGTAIAAAATIAPVSAVTHITGTAATVETITASTGCTTTGMSCTITLISDAGFVTGTTGNIATALTTVTGTAYHFLYDPATTKWYQIQ